ncbi:MULTISPECIES: hypothetical protein [unclassified Fibrobacter]|uniref:hypothetical protein n=1 Tax=unclassified Fibrobacter TaxID=2634177 RepID=UPI000D6D7EB4|nr:MULTISPECIES: hypothetical protein [unclassified Fibrobacter]PWJ53242.1 hypothetical protein BGX12_1842 [Fibrobacter sp. UWR4]PZW61298.1 hypothetical protein C8E88_10882 [Fibrobacter sp. UWR1]
MPFDFSLKDSIIPVSSTLIAASLIFSLINLMNQYYRIKIECLGWKKFFIPISLFVFFAAISSLVPYCSGAPFYCFGYPIFWNALSLACLIYFIYHLCNFILFEITYKENKKEYLRFIQACVRRNVETLLYINSIEKSIYDLVEDAQKEPPKENDLFEFSVQENNKYAWDVISLLSIRNVVKKIVENDSLFIQSVLNAYKEKGCARLTNVRLLNALIYQLVDNENSFLNLNNSGLKKEIIGNFFSKDLCSNFDTIGVFTIISKFNDEQQSTLELIFSRALDVTDVMHFGFASVLDSIKWELNKEISDRKILSYDKLYRETLDKCCKHSWNPIDAHNKDFYIRRFMDYFDALYLRNLKKGEYHL